MNSAMNDYQERIDLGELVVWAIYSHKFNGCIKNNGLWGIECGYGQRRNLKTFNNQEQALEWLNENFGRDDTNHVNGYVVLPVMDEESVDYHFCKSH